MSRIGFSAWFGPLEHGAQPVRLLHEAMLALGFESLRDHSSIAAGFIDFDYRARPLGPEPLTIAMGDNLPWGKLSLNPIPLVLREFWGVEGTREFLRELSEGLGVALGRTHGSDLHGVVYESELETGPEWLDWFQYWGASIVGHWGADHVEAGPFHLVEPGAQGASAVTLCESPEGPEQRLVRPKAARHLGITLRVRPGRRL